ncbi:MAG: hypothetical protein DKM24_08325 [Candidatus Melainabacteria bacterium]|nr:MAG: hypothetical protein DKM24_08325 [Candidatus Melainabacteria bacterium]
MVSGINFGNYSVAQLKELKNNGIQVPDEAIKAAETKEAEASKTDDNAEVKYEVADDASKTNEAQKEVETAKEYGANLKTILETLMKKDEGFIADMATLQGEIDKYKTQTEEATKQIDDISTEAQKEVDTTQEKAKTIEEQIAEKQKEYEAKMKELEELQQKENPTEEEQAKMQTLQTDIEALKGDVKSLSENGEKVADEAEVTTQSAQAKAEALGTTLETIKNDAEAAANKATNANEYADVTIEKGTEASNITSKKEAKAEGFKKRGFLGFGKKGDVKAANKMGNMAIATGEQLGGATVNIAKSVENVAKDFNISFAKTSNVKNLANKEYVDTTKFAEAKQKMEDSKGFWGKFRASKEVRSAANEIAEASKNKGKKTEEQTTAQKSGLSATIDAELLNKTKKIDETATQA